MKGGKGAKGGGKGYQGTCWNCGKIGHKAAECGQHVNEVDGEEAYEETEVGGVWPVGSIRTGDARKKTKDEGPPKWATRNFNKYAALAGECCGDEVAEWTEVARRGTAWSRPERCVVPIFKVDVSKKPRRAKIRFNVGKVQRPLASAAKVVE